MLRLAAADCVPTRTSSRPPRERKADKDEGWCPALAEEHLADGHAAASLQPGAAAACSEGAGTIYINIYTYILRFAQVTSTDRCVSLARLRYLPRFQETVPELLRALVAYTSDCPNSWASALDDDLAWLQCIAGDRHRAIRSLTTIWDWMRYAAACRPRWRSIINYAVAAETLRRNSEVYEVSAAAIVVHAETHIRGECGAVFGARSSLRSHFARAHLTNIARQYAGGEVCHGCLKKFTSREHVIYHMAFSKRGCLDLVMTRRQRLAAEEVAELDDLDCQRRRSVRSSGGTPRCACRPAHRLQGPLLRSLPAAVTPPDASPPEAGAACGAAWRRR